MIGSPWVEWENALPASAAVTSKQLLCFFIVWLIQAPLAFVHPNRIHWLYTVKGVIMPLATFGLLVGAWLEGPASKV